MAPIHHMMAHFPIALLFVALLLILARFFFDTPAIRRIEGALPLLLILGVGGGFAAFVSGLLIWPSEAITSSPMGRNKLLIAAWMLAAWSVVVLLRLRGGPELWEQGGRWPLMIMSMIGGVLLATTGTLGGYLLGSPSRFSDGLRAIGWDVYHTYFSPNWALGTAVILALVIIGIGFARRA